MESMNRFYFFLLAVLGVWRVTHLLNAEDGPWGIFVRLRRFAGTGFAGDLLDCFYCLSLWVSVPFACLSGDGWLEKLMLWLALSGAAIILERITAPASLQYSEDPPADTSHEVKK
jgi:hypothetical protein